MFKKLKNNDYNWTFQYIKEYNKMIAHYENLIQTKDSQIELLENEIIALKSSNPFKIKQKQISDDDIQIIRKLKTDGKSYSYISNVTGWSKATISRVINNKNNLY